MHDDSLRCDARAAEEEVLGAKDNFILPGLVPAVEPTMRCGHQSVGGEQRGTAHGLTSDVHEGND